MTCKLCGEERPLIDAHIIPASFFRDAQLGPEVLQVLSNDPREYPRRAPQGVYDQELVCESCERKFGPWDGYAAELLINRRDTAFRRLVIKGQIPPAQVVDPYDFEPLRMFVISLLWDRYNWRSSRLFRPRSVTWHIGSMERTVGWTDLASALVLGVMGAASVWVGLAGNSMPGPSGWQATSTVILQHLGKTVTDALSWIPNWVAAAGLLLVVVLLARVAWRQAWSEAGDVRDTQQLVESEEETLEHENT